MRLPTITALPLFALALVVPGVAEASSLHLTGTAGPASEIYPLYRAASGERNKVRITFGQKGLTVVDRGVRFITGEKGRVKLCKRRGPRRFFCPYIRYAEVRLGDRNDSVSFNPSRAGHSTPTSDPLDLAEPDFSDSEGAPEATTFIYGGTGDDTITGSSYTDYIDPGPGRDTVMARDSRDTIFARDDGVRDTLRGEGGIDSVYFIGKRAVAVDLAAGTGGGDQLVGIERAHGTAKADTLLGSDRADALYGEAGTDTIDGRAGNDLLTADRLFAPASVNHVTGGDGDDVIDVLGRPVAPGSTLDCGAGADRVAAGIDDLLPATCESAVFVVFDNFENRDFPVFGVPVKSAPVATDADGPTFEIPCPATNHVDSTGCTGTLTLESPPVAGSTAQPTSYGSAGFDLKPGESANVKVVLNGAGQAARAGGSPVAVHLKATLRFPKQPARDPLKADFGWQVVLPPGP
ncbi:MAG: hypothetical protein QOJ57_312 [Thermoleophilaceae bacterium]|nr:hypothetical protein [Thermoleophilaceae bacterium]